MPRLPMSGADPLPGMPGMPTAANEAAASLAGAPPPTRLVAGGRRRILTAAAIIMAGQLLSSVLGMVRIEAINILFYGVASGAFVVALRPIQQVSDLLVAGSVSGALIPTFVDESVSERREDLRRVYSTVANLVLLVMAAAALVLFVAAPAFVPVETQNFGLEGQALTVTLVRIAAFSLFGLGLYAVTSALLYALREVVYPAFATGIYHVGVVLCGVVALLVAAAHLGLPLSAIFHPDAGSPAVAQAHVLGARGLAVGAALGAAGEAALLLPGLRKVRVVWRPVLDLGHPRVRQILRLYAPVAAGLVLSVGQQNLEVFLIGRTPGGAPANATALQSATTLVQFPVGLVAAALSFAVLPSLAAAATRGDLDDFKRILALGFRLGLLLMVPAMVGLIVLRTPVVSLLFQHGACDHACSVRNALALQNYTYQLPFLAVDQLLIAAFYARKNTLTPVLVGVASIAFWLVVALPFAGSIGMPAVAFANTALNSGHAVILFALLTLAIGGLGLPDLFASAARIALAALAMGALCAVVATLLPHLLPGVFGLGHFHGQLLTVLAAAGLSALLYFELAARLGIEEVRLVRRMVRARLLGRE
jgi:putative peptidoglycan lipid II flippase